MVSRDHEGHLNELGRICWKLTLEPQDAEYPADSYVLPKNLGNRHLPVKQFFTTVVRNRANKVRRLPDESSLHSLGVVNRDFRRYGFRLWRDNALLDQALVRGFYL